VAEKLCRGGEKNMLVELSFAAWALILVSVVPGLAVVLAFYFRNRRT
jgi:hypothetical protein